MKAKILSTLMVLVISVIAIPMSVIADSGGGDGGPSVVGTLILDNKDGSTWQRIADGKYGIFTYNSSGATLNYSLAVAGLGATPTAYSLIYFADPYPGNKPGALIWSGDSTSAGRIDVAPTSIDLGMDLPTAPDSNMMVSHAGAPDLYTTPLGAKIWLIPTAYYNAGTKSVTAWNSTVISSILFETNLILYTDTDKPTPGIPAVTIVTTPTASIGLLVSPSTGLNFGSVEIGQWSVAGADRIVTLTNTGTVPIRVTAIPSAGFYTTSLYFGATHETASTLANTWSVVMPVSTTSLLVYARVYPLPGLTGTVTGSVAFMASFAP
jgi:hypothetical protein